jgi:hypothetical protein
MPQCFLGYSTKKKTKMSAKDKDLAFKIAVKDKKIADMVESAYVKGDYSTVFMNMQKRYKIYEEALPLLKTDPYYLYFITIMTDIMLEIAMFKTRQEFEEDIASIVSRLDSLENELKLIKRNSGQ